MTGQSLYSLMADAAQKERILLEHEGDLDAPEVQAILEVVDIQVPAKIDGYKFQIDRFRAMAEYLATQEKAIAAMKKRMQGAADRLEDNLMRVMDMHGTDILEGLQYDARIKLNPESVEVDDESKIPPEFFTITMKRDLSKAAVKDALKSGKQIEGARLVRRRKIELKPTTRKVGPA